MSTSNSSVTYSSGATGEVDLRLLHFNDVYHIEASSHEQLGGAARFLTLVNHYRSAPEFAGQPELLSFFSGDAFNPSLESSVTKGRHMVPILNKIGTNVACLGNHDLDFGVDQFNYLAKQCSFPWLCANVLDPALGGGVSIANLPKTVMLESSNGLKVGVIGLVEKEWLDTINSLPPNLQHVSADASALVLVPALREAGAEIVIAVSHQREPNDIKLANNIPAGLIDIILGGHDHHYAHEVINGCHVIRSGCDFKQLSYIEVRRNVGGSGPRWNFDIIRRDITKEISQDPETSKIVENITCGLKAKLAKPIGVTAVPLDARFSTVRAKESNIANFVCDVMRFYYSADCTLMAAGTIRGDQIYLPGVLKLGDIVECFPFDDPVVVIKIPGSSIKKALENGLSKLPAYEGRFPHVSNIFLEYDSSLPAGERIVSCRIGGADIVPDKKYSLATRGYMAKGKDGYEALTAEFGGAEDVVDDENGVLISTILRQYFLSLKVIGRWKRGSPFQQIFGDLQTSLINKGELIQKDDADKLEIANGDDADSDDDDEEIENNAIHNTDFTTEVKVSKLTGAIARKWARISGVNITKGGEELHVDWTRSIAPRLEGRIKDIMQ